MKTRKLKEELARADAAFWAWQADGPKPGFDVESYAEELADELKNRGHSDE
ncbi:MULTISPECIES: hypothetical protein [Rhizobium]|uniref:hypothetical protein n=1 Tax=Rhizobium TaxID=379 RepID=UPI0014416830|nr:hypothetical protein [Rhizobium leguminosarum]